LKCAFEGGEVAPAGTGPGQYREGDLLECAVEAAGGGDDLEICVIELASNRVGQLTDIEVDDYMPAWRP
jgi:hypothetical protein